MASGLLAGPIMSVEAKKIIVLHYQGIGDNVLALPMVQALRNACPNDDISVMVPEERFALFALTGVNLFTYSQRDEYLSTNIDIVLDLDTGSPDPKYAHLIESIECKHLVGFLHGLARSPAKGRVTRIPIIDQPMWRQYLRLAMIAIDAELAFDSHPVLKPTVKGSTYGLSLRSKADKPLICIAPGASIEEKRWPVESFKELIDYLYSDFDVQIVLVGSEDERHLSKTICDLCRNSLIYDLVGKTDIESLIGLVTVSELVIGNDSSVMHIAGACGTPVIALFGSKGKPRQHSPLGYPHTLLYAYDKPVSTISPSEVLLFASFYLSFEHENKTRSNHNRIVVYV